MRFPRGTRALALLCSATLAIYIVESQTVPVWGQTAEVTTKESPVTFQSGTNLVPVSVVVRDSKGHAVGNLSIDDFQLSDNGKAQMISKFSVEKIVPEPAPAATSKPAAPTSVNTPTALTDANTTEIPDRFIAYLFDDLHLTLGDLVRTREAAKHQLDSGLGPMSRAAIYTTSGHQTQEFTSDHDKLHAALDAITATEAIVNKAQVENSCPPVDYYMADRIYNQHDLSAWKIAVEDALSCSPPSGPGISDVQVSAISDCEASGSSDGICLAVRNAKQAARAALSLGDRDTDASLATLRAVVSRMASMPGQRSIILITPGFLVLDTLHDEENNIVNRAIKANVVIGGLDARGLYTQTMGGDASDRGNARTMIEKRPYQLQETLMQTDVVANLADGTGGTFFHGTNDYDDGMQRVATVPDYIYVLGFSPLDLKLDGKFHTLKVTLKTPKGLDLQVRKGYYAPKASGDPASQATEQIEEAFFSKSEVHDLPAILQTQYFKMDDGDATLSAVAKVDVRKLTYHKEGDRNRNDITVITGLFDNDGNYISGQKKVVEMRFLDETLAKRAASGISVKNSFTVHPGRYVVRLVVRDSEGQMMSAQSSLVEIP